MQLPQAPLSPADGAGAPNMHRDVYSLPVSLVYQDEHLAVVDKPSGMLVHRSPGVRDPVVVMTWVRDALGVHAWPVHRLDRDTSGLVVVALTLRAAQRMYALFQAGAIRKTYLAGVAGAPPPSGRIEVPLEKRPGLVQAAVTEYEVLASMPHGSVVRVHPRTGRRHQIRRHFQAHSHPLLGDRLYGDPEHNRAAAVGLGLERLALHGAHLSFPHPLTGSPLELEAPLPADLAGALGRGSDAGSR